jgi:hypothetical protein
VAPIPPGLVIDKSAPKGWSHLIVKSGAVAGAGDVAKMSATTRELSGLFFSAIVANVTSEKTSAGLRYRLDKVAVGLGTRIAGVDKIISLETQRDLGANLGFLQRTALRKATDRIQNVQMVARSDSLAVVDAPVYMLLRNKHLPATLRYVVLVDPKTGQLNTLIWAIERSEAGDSRGVVGHMEWLPPNKVEERVLHVDASEFSLGLVTERAMAMTRLFKGKTQIDFPKDFVELAGQTRFSEASAARLETKLRELLRAHSD